MLCKCWHQARLDEVFFHVLGTRLFASALRASSRWGEAGRGEAACRKRAAGGPPNGREQPEGSSSTVHQPHPATAPASESRERAAAGRTCGAQASPHSALPWPVRCHLAGRRTAIASTPAWGTREHIASAPTWRTERQNQVSGGLLLEQGSSRQRACGSALTLPPMLLLAVRHSTYSSRC